MDQTQSFNDGIAHIWNAVNAAAPGKKPVARLKPVCKIRYHQRIVGYGRYWEAYQNAVTVSYLVRCPRVMAVKAEQIVTLSGNNQFYRIKQLQYPEDVTPPVMDLTLEIAGDQFETE